MHLDFIFFLTDLSCDLCLNMPVECAVVLPFMLIFGSGQDQVFGLLGLFTFSPFY